MIFYLSITILYYYIKILVRYFGGVIHCADGTPLPPFMGVTLGQAITIGNMIDYI